MIAGNIFLLKALESFLGDIDQWPSTVLSSLFIDAPNLSNINRVAAFFYGNDVPLYVASYFYDLCNAWGGSYASEVMHTYYSIWKSARYSSHLALYYNTTFKQYMYINGR
jgi:hypothetical protein